MRANVLSLERRTRLCETQVEHLNLRITLHYFLFMALAKAHPDPHGLLCEFQQASEHLLADSLTRNHHEGVLDVVREELAGIEEALAFLDKRRPSQ